MRIEEYLTPARTLWGASSTSKKRTLQNAANFIAEQEPALNAKALFRALIDRERLGSTGIGEGVAIPHCRMDDCPSIIGTLISLEQAIDFESIDGQPVDILFVLLVPSQASDEHLQVLAHLAQLFSRPEYRQSLRQAGSSSELYRLATSLDDG